MLALLQRVTNAEVLVDGNIVGVIEKGILVFLGIEKGDAKAQITKMADKIIQYRIFGDENDNMNLSVKDVEGSLLVVSQFTLAANTQKGLRPSFTPAAPPELAENLYEQFVAYAGTQIPVQTGIFGANMQVSLTNDGPVTFLLRVNAN